MGPRLRKARVGLGAAAEPGEMRVEGSLDWCVMLTGGTRDHRGFAWCVPSIVSVPWAAVVRERRALSAAGPVEFGPAVGVKIYGAEGKWGSGDRAGRCRSADRWRTFL